MDKANDLDTELKLRLMDKAELYRIRLLRLKSAETKQELNKAGGAGCAKLRLRRSGNQPAISSPASKELTMLQETG